MNSAEAFLLWKRLHLVSDGMSHSISYQCYVATLGASLEERSVSYSGAYFCVPVEVHWIGLLVQKVCMEEMSYGAVQKASRINWNKNGEFPFLKQNWKLTEILFHC